MEDPFTYEIIGCCIAVQRELHCGLSENIYHHSVIRELEAQGFEVESEVLIEYAYRGPLPVWGKMDLRVRKEDRCGGLELKSVQQIHESHRGQAMSYAKFDPEVEGVLLINFGTAPLEVERFVGPRGWRHETR